MTQTRGPATSRPLLSVWVVTVVGHLVAGLLTPNASPFLAVGNTAIDLAPAPVKEFAVRTFGNYDKRC